MKTKTNISLIALAVALSCVSVQAAPLLPGPIVPVVTDEIDVVNSIVANSEISEKNIDPLEGLNRGVHSFNQGLDKVLLKPMATAYKTVVPSMARQGVNNFLSYLHTPLDVLNYALQGNGVMAGNAMGRFMLNTFGLGVLDIASEAGISRKQTGFGETLGVWGAPAGPYVVLPLFGGRSLRGTVGTFGDSQVGLVGQLKVDEQTAVIALDALDTRTRLLGVEDLMSDAALDEYSFVRDALMQREKNRIEELKE